MVTKQKKEISNFTERLKNDTIPRNFRESVFLINDHSTICGGNGSTTSPL